MDALMGLIGWEWKGKEKKKDEKPRWFPFMGGIGVHYIHTQDGHHSLGLWWEEMVGVLVYIFTYACIKNLKSIREVILCCLL